MTTKTTISDETLERLRAKISEDCSAVDMDRAYRDMLDELFSFESVGGPFSHMQASHVLEEMDPTAFRCGFNDYTDSERETVQEIGEDYFRIEDLEEARTALVDEMRAEADADAEEGADPDYTEADALEAFDLSDL